ncbi:MAG TPA: maltose ABC transporter permease MalF [Ideonella sp.]|nr:maltose ABC transporter permease MalF [Ideonella sp.]
MDWGRPLKWPVTLGVAVAALWMVFRLYASGQPVLAAAALGLVAIGFVVYLSNIGFAYRYLFPGLVGMAVFVAFPLFYTVQIGFTNYSSSNLLSFERATAYLLEQTAAAEGEGYGFTLHGDGAEFRVVLAPHHEEEDEEDPAKLAELRARSFVSPPLALLGGASPPADLALAPLKDSGFTPAEALPLSDVLKHRAALAQLKLRLPGGNLLSYAGVREFSPLQPVWQRNADGSLTQTQSSKVFQPNPETGFYETQQGGKVDRVQPGYKVGIGFGNYARMINDPDFRGPFFAIFLWTVAFAGLTVVCTLLVGFVLAVLLNWEALRFRGVYRTLLFLPYAVPAFISILVFKGLFNQNFGEINQILGTVLGLRPAWFADPTLAKVMIVLVNTWLGYPYIMVLSTALIKAIPADLYEASAIAGAGPIDNLLKITLPQIIRPLTPLLIASFAFNFNNFVLIALLTNGRPDFLGTKVPAGTTDILVSYTYRIAFQDSGQNFGLAAAISTVIFFLIAMLSMANLRLAKVNEDKR